MWMPSGNTPSRTGTATGLLEYAQKFGSDKGKKNGLYWKVKEGEEQSPLGPLAAAAQKQGYSKKGEKPEPFYGYYYRILTGQGKNAPGGAYDYMVKGNMIGGFALVAYPAKYAVFWRHDLYRESRWSGLSERPGPEYGEDGSGDEALQSGQHVEESEVGVH